jgi:hypothetical protein
MQQMGNVRAVDLYKTNSLPPLDSNQSSAAEAWFKNKYNLQRAQPEPFPQKPAAVFKEAVKALTPPPVSVSSRPVQPQSQSQSPLRQQAAIPPQTDPAPRLRPTTAAPLANASAPFPPQVIESETVLEPSNRNPRKSEIMALYHTPPPPKVCAHA